MAVWKHLSHKKRQATLFNLTENQSCSEQYNAVLKVQLATF